MAVRVQEAMRPPVASTRAAWYTAKMRLPGCQEDQLVLLKAIAHAGSTVPEEVAIHTHLSHRGVVSVLAHEIDVSQKHMSYLVLNTTGALPLDTAQSLSTQKILVYARQLAVALCYLHHHNPPIRVGCLSPAGLHVLQGECQIVDLSLARRCHDASRSAGELLEDIAQLGDCIWQMLTNKAVPSGRSIPEDSSIVARSGDDNSILLLSVVSRCWAAPSSKDLRACEKIVQLLDSSFFQSLSLRDCVERKMLGPALEIATAHPNLIHPLSLSASAGVADSPLRQAIQLGHAEITSALLQLYIESTLEVDCGLLIVAAGSGHTAVLSCLLKVPAFVQNINISDANTGRTALHVAAMQDRLAAVGLLLRAGATVLATDYNNKTPLHLALEFSASDKLITALISSCSSPVEFATLMRTPSSRMLATPLHAAILMGRTNVVSLLLKSNKMTPEIRRLMLSVRDSSGKSLVSIAASVGKKDVFALLIKDRTVLEQRDDNRRNVCHICAQVGHAELLGLVLRDPASQHLINQVDSNGSTPLHLAARWNHPQVVKLLLSCNAQPSLRDRNGDTPLDLAQRHSHRHIVQQLQQYTCIAMLNSDSAAAGDLEPPEAEKKKNSFNNSLPGSSCFEAGPKMLPDSAADDCFACHKAFALFRRRHHCRACGLLFCAACSSTFVPLPQFGHIEPVRVCDLCTKIPLRRDSLLAAPAKKDQHLNFVI